MSVCYVIGGGGGHLVSGIFICFHESCRIFIYGYIVLNIAILPLLMFGKSQEFKKSVVKEMHIRVDIISHCFRQNAIIIVWIGIYI